MLFLVYYALDCLSVAPNTHPMHQALAKGARLPSLLTLVTKEYLYYIFVIIQVWETLGWMT